MEFNIIPSKSKVCIKDIDQGEVFLWDGDPFMKVRAVVLNGVECNVVDLNMGAVLCVPDDTLVLPVESCLTVEE